MSYQAQVEFTSSTLISLTSPLTIFFFDLEVYDNQEYVFKKIQSKLFKDIFYKMLGTVSSRNNIYQ